MLEAILGQSRRVASRSVATGPCQHDNCNNNHHDHNSRQYHRIHSGADDPTEVFRKDIKPNQPCDMQHRSTLDLGDGGGVATLKSPSAATEDAGILEACPVLPSRRSLLTRSESH